MTLAYIRKAYGVPARRGARVCVYGRSGVITTSRGAHIRVRYDDCKYSVPCHPTNGVQYIVPTAGVDAP